MNHVSFSEDALRQAAALVRQSMLDSMPLPSQCTHEFSPGFQGKMERLISRERPARKRAQSHETGGDVFPGRAGQRRRVAERER